MINNSDDKDFSHSSLQINRKSVLSS